MIIAYMMPSHESSTRAHFDVAFSYVQLPQMNWSCNSGNDSILVFWPTNAVRRPLVVFAHGRGNSPDFYFMSLRYLAAAGFVVAAPMVGSTGRLNCDVWCALGLQQDVSKLIEAAFERRYTHPFALIDWEYPVGISGHSMGGLSIFLMQKYAKGPFSIGAVVSFSPPTFVLPDNRSQWPDRVAPLMLVAGSLEETTYRADYSSLLNFQGDDVFVLLEGMGHNDGPQSPDLAESLIATFFECHLQFKENACSQVHDQWHTIRRWTKFRESHCHLRQCKMWPNSLDAHPPPLSLWCPGCRIPTHPTQTDPICLQRSPAQCIKWLAYKSVAGLGGPPIVMHNVSFGVADYARRNGGASTSPSCLAADRVLADHATT